MRHTTTPQAAITVTSTPTPTSTVTQTVVQAPARVVYVPAAAPAAPALTNCGGGVLAGPGHQLPVRTECGRGLE
jgi:hypothetical protein